jgi:hypothetical protein
MRYIPLATVLLVACTFSHAFVVTPPFRCSSTAGRGLLAPLAASTQENPNDLELDRVQHKFKDLQDELLEELAEQRRSNAAAEDIAATMLDLAADAVALQRYKKMEELDAAQEDLVHASGDRAAISDLKREAHEAALSAEREATMVEAMDDNYEGMERLREGSVAHAARHLEHDALEREVEARFQELEASSKAEDAEGAISELREYEVRLRESAVEVRQHKVVGDKSTIEP